jgi:hypothetical protein
MLHDDGVKVNSLRCIKINYLLPIESYIDNLERFMFDYQFTSKLLILFNLILFLSVVKSKTSYLIRNKLIMKLEE